MNADRLFLRIMIRCSCWVKCRMVEVTHTVVKTTTMITVAMTAILMSTLVRAEEAKLQTHFTAQPATQFEVQSQTQTASPPQAQSKTQTQAKSERAQSQVRGATSPETPKKITEQGVAESKQQSMRYPYQWISNYLYRQYLDDLASERRERLRLRSEALRESFSRYSSASRWLYTPWAEANRKWLEAPQDYLRDLADLRREQILAESDYRRKMLHPLLSPGPAAAWGPYGMGPWKPNLGPWGPYP